MDGCNWQCYMDNYPGLAKACGSAKDPFSCAQNHWTNSGKNEGRDCTCTTTTTTTTVMDGCNWQCYMDNYPGLAKACGSAKDPFSCAQNHWIQAGKSQGKDCTCTTTTTTTTAIDGCNWQCYMDRYPGLAEACGSANDPFSCAKNNWIQA